MGKESDEEDFIQSLDSYSKEIETKIDIIISLRALIKTIDTIELFLKDKTHIIQSLFETEDLLRNSCLFLKKNYFKHKKSLRIECNCLDSFHVVSTINPTGDKQSKNCFSDCDYGTIDIQAPVTMNHNKEEPRLNNNNNDSSLNTCQQLETISFQLSTDKDIGIMPDTINNKENRDRGGNGNVIKESNTKMKQGCKSDSMKKTNKAYNDFLEYMNIKRNLYKEPLKLEINSYNDNKIMNLLDSEINEEEEKGISNAKINQQPIQLIKHSIVSMTKDTASRIADVIMKLNINVELYDMIVMLFNKNILDQLLTIPINHQLLDSIEKSIKEIEVLQSKGNQATIRASNKGNTNKHTQHVLKPNHSSRAIVKDFTSCPIRNNKEQGIAVIGNSKGLILSHCSLNNSLNKKAPLADELLQQNGFGIRKTLMANYNSNKKNNAKNNRHYSSMHSLQQYDSSTNNRKSNCNSNGNNKTIKANSMLDSNALLMKSANKKSRLSSLKKKANFPHKLIKGKTKVEGQ